MVCNCPKWLLREQRGSRRAQQDAFDNSSKLAQDSYTWFTTNCPKVTYKRPTWSKKLTQCVLSRQRSQRCLHNAFSDANWPKTGKERKVPTIIQEVSSCVWASPSHVSGHVFIMVHVRVSGHVFIVVHLRMSHVWSVAWATFFCAHVQNTGVISGMQ